MTMTQWHSVVCRRKHRAGADDDNDTITRWQWQWQWQCCYWWWQWHENSVEWLSQTAPHVTDQQLVVCSQPMSKAVNRANEMNRTEVNWTGLEKIMIKKNRKNQISFFDFLDFFWLFDLNRIFFYLNFFFAFFSAVVHCCCIKQFKLHCELHIAQNSSSWTSDYKLKSVVDELNNLNNGQNKTIKQYT